MVMLCRRSHEPVLSPLDAFTTILLREGYAGAVLSAA